MTQSTILAIILALLLICAIVIAIRNQRITNKLQQRVVELNSEILRRKCAANDCASSYSFDKLFHWEEDTLGCYWTVYRAKDIDGNKYITYIKIFTDEDDEFNQREAHELCDKLNEI